jgi:hypothetical protein
MLKKEVLIDNFIEEAVKELNVFKNEWTKNNKKDPEGFPLLIECENFDEWWLQFKFHLKYYRGHCSL